MMGGIILKHVIGARFDRLAVIGLIPDVRRRQVLALCDCGTEKIFYLANLVSGTTKSCGCLRHEYLLTHGETVGGITAECRCWAKMINRCTNPRNPDWERYGGRGIKICQEWRHDYPAFLAHVGRKPSPQHSIDRYPNNDGNYEPGNVRWATPKEQAANRRRPKEGLKRNRQRKAKTMTRVT